MKLFISQPMRGRSLDAILRERKSLTADAAVALQVDRLQVLNTLFQDQDSPPLELLGRSLQMLAQADAAIFAPGWQDARGCRIEHEAAEAYGIRVIEG